jgi:1-aminocyclopropane-1-carboxylate synthase
MNTYFKHSSFTSDNIAFSAGASASLEVSSFILANPGDVVMIPAPSYPMYTKDLGIKSLIERYDLQTHFEIDALSSLARINTNILENALHEIESKEKHFRILLLTSPDNPSGSIYSEKQLLEISNWCIKRKVHLIVNEIYALSQFDIKDNNASKEVFEFVSFAKIMAEQESEYLHLIYALSKDFSASGLRFGIIHSLNQKFLQALENVNIPHMVSNLTQWTVGEMFRDKLFIENYVKENKRRISETYLLVSKVLESLEIPFVPNKGSLFIWADFSKYLVGDSLDAEMNLWVHIFKETGVLLTPGIGFQHKKNGLFRIVHTAVPAPHLQMAMDKLYSYLKKRPVSKSDYF